MNQCSKCVSPPTSIASSGTLCVAPPLAHTFGTIREFLVKNDVLHRVPSANLLAIDLAPGTLGQLANGLCARLSQNELRDTGSLIIRDVESLSLADLALMQPLATLFSRVHGEWFTDMLREERLTSHFQPIFHVKRVQEVFGHECLLRGVGLDGGLVSPGRLFQAARDSDLLFPLDRSARLTAIREAASHGLGNGEDRLFINFNPTSIYDPVFCLRSTVAAIAATNLKPERIVFEIVESDHVNDLAHLLKITKFYRDAGFKIALDDLGAGYGSLNLLGQLKPDFVKLDMELLRGIDLDPYKSRIVGKILEMAQMLGLATIAEGIETEGEWNWVREHGADYVQGYYFAKPSGTPMTSRRLEHSAI